MNFCISSSIEVKIHENIFRKIRTSENMPCDLMDILRFDSKRRIVRFISLKELWKTGLIIKKYIEYPCHTYSELGNVLSELNDYLQKGGYIEYYVDENIVSEDIVYITSISLEHGRISFFYKKLSGTIEEETISYEEYYKRFLPSGLRSRKVRFDVYSLVEESDLAENISRRPNKSRKISKVQELCCLQNQQDAASDSVQALLEWFHILEELDEKKWKGSMECVQDIISQKKNGRKNLHMLIKVYNEIVQRMVSEGECYG